jgi:hypothetical protein
MTVYRSIEEARIDPSILCKKESELLGMRSWFDDATRIYKSDDYSAAFKTGYIFATLEIIKARLESHGL